LASIAVAGGLLAEKDEDLKGVDLVDALLPKKVVDHAGNDIVAQLLVEKDDARPFGFLEVVEGIKSSEKRS